SEGSPHRISADSPLATSSQVSHVDSSPKIRHSNEGDLSRNSPKIREISDRDTISRDDSRTNTRNSRKKKKGQEQERPTPLRSAG
ncbi:MAG: hypothetical protein SVU32_01720, partial [Candidatus Nanohaloarchaea archaeon]|nr:hypothetical protein [Candidatus Nanohaloarchaea archaeon]